jgi:hypothetical protein
MCFSTNMSLGAGAALGVIGILSVRKVRKPSQLAFAAIPLLFSTQQFSEAFVWLSLTNKQYETWETSAVNVFLFFAQALWPAWVPFSIWLLEKEAKHQKILLFLTGMVHYWLATLHIVFSFIPFMQPQMPITLPIL